MRFPRPQHTGSQSFGDYDRLVIHPVDFPRNCPAAFVCSGSDWTIPSINDQSANTNAIRCHYFAARNPLVHIHALTSIYQKDATFLMEDKKGQTQLRLAQLQIRPNRPFYEVFRRFPPGSAARSVALGITEELSVPPDKPEDKSALGPPLNLRQVASLIGCSPWTVRQVLIPLGLPHFRSGASGKMIFYTDQVVRWIERRQLKGGFNR
jgi:hypothetical protein